MTLEGAKAAVEARVAAGEAFDCPCCGRLCKIDQRKLHAEVAVNLMRLVAEAALAPAGRYFGVRDFVRGGKGSTKASSDVSYLVHWGLLEHPGRDRYRPTAAGVAFARGELAVPSYVKTYRNNRVGQSRKLVTIREALGTKFDYDAMTRDAVWTR